MVLPFFIRRLPVALSDYLNEDENEDCRKIHVLCSTYQYQVDEGNKSVKVRVTVWKRVTV
jgi:hypothetical protein